MRYRPGHKDRVRSNLLAAAGALAKQDGFANTGVDRLMASVGLTSGGFYAHFRSKSELLGAIVEHELNRSLERLADKSDEALIVALESYLSTTHVDHPAQGCAVTAMSSEIARSDIETRQVFERLMLRIRDELGSHLASEADAWVLVSQMIGAVTIARAMASGEVRESLLDAVMQRSTQMIRDGKESGAVTPVEQRPATGRRKRPDRPGSA